MDNYLAKAIVDLKIPFFGDNLRNKHDSQSCMFDPRKLLSSPDVLKHVGKRMADIALTKCSGNALIGLATSGIPWGAVCSLYSKLPFLYVRKHFERHMSNKLIEGVPPPNAEFILIDDLLYAGMSKAIALEIIKKHNLRVTDVIVLIDRQLQRKKDGPQLQEKYGVKVHSLITMDDIIAYMKATDSIEKRQLKLLIRDYRQYERWNMPIFAL